MRIISGIYKGKNVLPPKHFNSRPTTDFAKESLFNILNNYIDFNTIEVLDLFSGTGNISYEFISRGCKQVTCVELNKKNAIHLKALFSIPEIQSKVNIVNYDAYKICKNGQLNYDVIFADPPYDYKFTFEMTEFILKNPSLKKDALIVIEHSSRLNLTGIESFFRSENYGEVHFSFFRKA